ncbi:MAG: hypothetical protein KDI82_09960 [Gammaproteobacteria bacterium]|nr:hypothetical protein [Gammaproteobacteria bacterium]
MTEERRLRIHTRHVPVLLSMAALSGCAAFNDVVVVDVGEQFHLLEMAPNSDPSHSQATVAKGFDCTFSATSVRTSLLAREKRIDGTIRCQRIEPE